MRRLSLARAGKTGIPRATPAATSSYLDAADQRLNVAEEALATDPARAQAEALIAIGDSLLVIARELRRLRLARPHAKDMP
jgi:hypothetical protein